MELQYSTRDLARAAVIAAAYAALAWISNFFGKLACIDNGVCGYVANFSSVSYANSYCKRTVTSPVLLPDDGLKCGGHGMCLRYLVNNSKTFMRKWYTKSVYKCVRFPEILRLWPRRLLSGRPR